jgi:hypothetical protein
VRANQRRQLPAAAKTIAATSNQSTTGTSAINPAKEPTEIYQWTDASGRIHYSDLKRE